MTKKDAVKNQNEGANSIKIETSDSSSNRQKTSATTTTKSGNVKLTNSKIGDKPSKKEPSKSSVESKKKLSQLQKQLKKQKNEVVSVSKQLFKANDKVKDLETQVKNEKDRRLRTFAEYENYRKRTNKELLDASVKANKNLIVALLPIIDDFERAEQQQSEEQKELYDGYQLIYNKLLQTLKFQGLELTEVKKGQKFDPDLHDAIAHLPSEAEPGIILDITEKGYSLGDLIVRHPKVVVSKEK